MTQSIDLDAESIVRFHADELLHRKAGAPAPIRPDTPIWQAIARNHHHNIELWDEEDQARRVDVPDSAIAACKRRIDRHNQQRNDAIEAIDEHFLASSPVLPTTDARLHSETLGALIDRLSILSLKRYHTDWQTRRPDVDADHVAISRARLERLREQHHDLTECLTALLRGCRDGSLHFKVYRQFKMYNDPRFNPCLAGIATAPTTACHPEGNTRQ